MFNYSQERLPHKLLMEIHRNEQVPKLVTLQEVSRSKDARNKLLLQARTQTHHMKTEVNSFAGTQRKVAARPKEVRDIQQNIVQQPSQSGQLRQVIKEMRSEMQKLREVNEGLITRLKQVQSSYRSLSSELQRTHREQQRKLKINIYKDVEEYIKVIVQRLTLTLRQQKMTLGIQKKLQRFLAQLMEINSVTVEQFVKLSKFDPFRQEPHQFQQSRATVSTKYVTNNKLKREETPTQQHYASIMQRLTGEPKMSKSYAAAGMGYGTAASQDTKYRNVYATTPQKRKRIFQ